MRQGQVLQINTVNCIEETGKSTSEESPKKALVKKTFEWHKETYTETFLACALKSLHFT